ncbi:MAG: hypothetical protein U9N59_08675 [Campylobacterota bacterium]|nr:hypothetical protein [Campylobacterota bacterium]
MANLKGGSFEKQNKDIFHRLSAFGTKRHGQNSNLTHSSSLGKKRTEYSKSYAKFIANKGLSGKLNHHMNNENIKEFLTSRTSNMGQKSTINYYAGFGSMIQGLKDSNVDIDFDKNVITNLVNDAKNNMDKALIKSNQAIKEPDKMIKDISTVNFTASVIAQVQLLGYRVSEAFSIVKDISKYYNPFTATLNNVVGKGNHTYEPKAISNNLIHKINSIDKMISQKTYHNTLKEFNINSHQWRYTYAKNTFDKVIKAGVEYKKALKLVSVGLNHKRESMSLFYLQRS